MSEIKEWISEYKIWIDSNCPNHNFVYRYKLTSNNRMYVKMQCEKCDYSPSENLKKKDIKDFDLLVASGDIKELLPDDTWLKYDSFSDTRRKEKEDEILKEKERRKENYQIYIKSEEWLKIRKLVFKRDNYTCQGCLEKEATEVHHKNYNHLFNEILFDLVSVCKPCHDKIHSKKQL